MKNIMKIMLALLTSVSLVGSATAGELTVTGSAKATYNILSGGDLGASQGQGKGLGITNELDFGATGELDNGWSWKYQVQFDPNATASTNQIDDTRLELTTDYGVLGVYVSEGGLDVDNAASQSVYGRPTDIGNATGIVDGPGIDGFNNVQLHTPADLLPYSTVIKAAYAPGAQVGMNSGNAGGSAVAVGNFLGSVQQYQIKSTPMDGLNVGADYLRHTDQGNAVTKVVQAEEAGSVFATYTYGAASFGVSRTLVAPLILSTSATESVIGNATAAGRNAAGARDYTNNKMSAAYNVNDNLSVSYEVEKSDREVPAGTANFDIKAQAVQAAYTMGGMTLSLSMADVDNVGYADGKDQKQTLFAMSMVF
jgi:hypothetical protein